MRHEHQMCALEGPHKVDHVLFVDVLDSLDVVMPMWAIEMAPFALGLPAHVLGPAYRITRSHSTASAGEVPPALIAELERRNRLDVQLYAHATHMHRARVFAPRTHTTRAVPANEEMPRPAALAGQVVASLMVAAAAGVAAPSMAGITPPTASRAFAGELRGTPAETLAEIATTAASAELGLLAVQWALNPWASENVRRARQPAGSFMSARMGGPPRLGGGVRYSCRYSGT